MSIILPSSVKYELKLLIQKIHFLYKSYIDFVRDQNITMGPVQVQMMDEQRNKIQTYLVNASYFINKLRRKQGIIKLKQIVTEGIKKRDEATEEMQMKLKEACEFLSSQ